MFTILLKVGYNSIMKSKNCKVLAVTSGKGGVGKSNFCINLAICLARQGYNTILFDADLALGNADLLFGELPKKTIEDIINDDTSINDILLKKKEIPNLSIIPAGKGVARLANLSSKDKKKLLGEIGKLKDKSDFLIIDTGAGVSDEVISFIKLADSVILIIIPEVTSIKDAYGMLKTLKEKNINKEIDVLVNRAKSKTQTHNVFDKFKETVGKFLGIKINLLGPLPEDENFTESVNRQIPIVLLYPNSQVTRFFKYYADQVAKNVDSKSDIENFFEQYIEEKESMMAENTNLVPADSPVNQPAVESDFIEDPYFLVQMEKTMSKMFEDINNLYKTIKLYMRKRSSEFVKGNIFKQFAVGTELIFVEDKKRFYGTNIVGWSLGQYLIIESRKEIRRLFDYYEKVTARYSFQDKLIEFETSLIKGFEPNSSLINISYPQDYTEYSLRGSKRIPVNIACSINYKNIKTFSGSILDLSVNGALLETSYPLDINEGIIVSFSLPNGKKIENVKAKIKNIRENNRYGVEFVELPKIFFRRIESFINIYKSILGETENIASDKFFSGEISNISMSELIQFLCGLRRELTVEVLTSTASGQIFIKDSKVVNAVYKDFDPYQSFYILMNLKEGEFFINEGLECVEFNIKENLQTLLLNSVYYQDTGVVNRPDEV
jgi:flagellar biosynthesis protein FlhG